MFQIFLDQVINIPQLTKSKSKGQMDTKVNEK